MSCIAVTPHRAQLGEGPFWDAPTQALYWVNIAGKQALRLMGGQLQIWQLPEHVSAFIPCESGDALVTLSSGVYRLDLATEALTLLCVADPQPGNRGNEARCDAQGRLWLGTMQNNIGNNGEDLPIVRRSGGLFRIDPDQRVTPLLRGLGIPNTLLWSDDGTRLRNHASADSLGQLLDRAAQVELTQALQVFGNAGGELPLPTSAGENLVRARWLLEEFRISLFAQKLGTKEPVSLQRIKKALQG